MKEENAVALDDDPEIDGEDDAVSEPGKVLMRKTFRRSLGVGLVLALAVGVALFVASVTQAPGSQPSRLTRTPQRADTASIPRTLELAKAASIRARALQADPPGPPGSEYTPRRPSTKALTTKDVVAARPDDAGWHWVAAPGRNKVIWVAAPDNAGRMHTG